MNNPDSRQADTKNDDRIRDEMSEKIIEVAEQLATTEGAGTLTVRKILQTMDITNRVFYNRFRNIEEVLQKNRPRPSIPRAIFLPRSSTLWSTPW